MPPTDLIASARAGDLAAIGELLAAAQPDIRRYARVTCRADDVDDAVQDTLWIVHRRLGGLRAASAFSGWVFAIVKRECLRLARLVNAGSVTIDSMADDRRLASRPDTELRLDLGAAIQSLPSHYREIIVLRDLEELTIDEIAFRLQATRESVKARLRRARLLVREYLER